MRIVICIVIVIIIIIIITIIIIGREGHPCGCQRELHAGRPPTPDRLFCRNILVTCIWFIFPLIAVIYFYWSMPFIYQ